MRRDVAITGPRVAGEPKERGPMSEDLESRHIPLVLSAALVHTSPSTAGHRGELGRQTDPGVQRRGLVLGRV